MPIKFYCKHCGQKLSVASKKAGKKVSCPACQVRITIPLQSESQRSEQKPNPAPPTEASQPTEVLPTQAMDLEQNQLLDDLDNLGPLGESWDELLEGDLEETASRNQKAPVEPEQSEPPAVPPTVDSDINEPEPETVESKVASESAPEVDDSPVEQEAAPAAEQETAIETSQTPPPAAVAARPAYVEEDDEEDDDDEDGFGFRSVESEFEEMDLTPMVDVTFLLLIFFMITASFSLQKSIEVPPPNPDDDGVSQSLQTLDDFREESIIVEIDSNNGIYVDDTKLSNPAEIVQAILDRRDADGKPKSELVLSAHNAARHETVVAVVDAANEVGMQKIRMASYKGPED